MEGLYNINYLFEEAEKRWLKPAEVLYILRNHENCYFTHNPPHKPPGGSVFLFNKRIRRFFRKDGHNWRKKRDGRVVAEPHERLKVGNDEILNCYYAIGDENPTLQRRSYWMLEPEYEHIVLVHYRDTRKLENQMDRAVDAIMSFTERIDSAIRSSSVSYSGEYSIHSFSSVVNNAIRSSTMSDLGESSGGVDQDEEVQSTEEEHAR